MAVGVGNILFTAVFTDNDTGGGTAFNDSFSFVATTNIAAGETITFHAPKSVGDATITYTVGANGLSAFDRVTIQTDTDPANPPGLLNDPSNGMVTGYAFTGTQTTFELTGIDNLIASSGGAAIAGIVNNISASWDDNFNVTGLDRTAIDAAIAAPTDPLPVLNGAASNTSDDDNIMFEGGNITGIDDPSNWVTTEFGQNYSAPEISGISYAVQDGSIFCFAAGTRIATPTGEVAVEALVIGGSVRTFDGRSVPVKWIGRQTIVKGFAGERASLVRIGAGALGNHSDLYVTGDHGMVVDGCLINASALVNGADIVWVPLSETPDRQTVYHVETEAHDIILANGAASETYLDIPGRRAFDNFQEYLDLYGAEQPIAVNPLPRISSARLVPPSLKRRHVA